MDRGAWWTIVHGATKSQTQLSNSHTLTLTHTHTHTHTLLYVREITGTYCVAQETLLWEITLEKILKKNGYMYIHTHIHTYN